jgi:hypothetical protein
MLDKDHNFLDIAYQQIDGGAQVGTTPKAPHDYMSREVVIQDAGYAYVYVSNESPTYVEVYFDDVAVTYTPTNIIQYNEYYAFGLQTQNSWTRDGNSNNFLYNAATELNTTSGLYDLKLAQVFGKCGGNVGDLCLPLLNVNIEVF